MARKKASRIHGRVVVLPKTKKEFKRARNWISIFEGQVVDIAEGETEKLARSYAHKVRTTIYRQSYAWKPLSERYLAYKKRKRLDQRILVATKTYVQSIQAQPLVRGNRIIKWRVGPGQMNEIHPPSGLRFKTLARILEFGSRRHNIPARPHWRPTWSAFIRSKEKKRFFKRVSDKARRAATRKAKRTG